LKSEEGGVGPSATPQFKPALFGPRLPSICCGAVVSRHQRPAREFGQMAHWPPPGGLDRLPRSALLATVAAVCMAAVWQFKCAYLLKADLSI